MSMTEWIVALSVDKIQTFLTEVIHSHVQEKQTEEATLRDIMDSSVQISKDFFEDVEKAFFVEEDGILLKCSGVYIFRSALQKKELECKLDMLFESCYRMSNGQKLIRWVYFSSEGSDRKIDMIQKAKKELKRTENWNRILERHRDMLFSFQPVKKTGREKKDWDFPQFAGDINALGPQEGDEGGRKNRFRIAVIKADLDGMGTIFQNIRDYEEYRRISEILNEEISIEGLHRAAMACAPEQTAPEQIAPENKKGWLFPFYIAGDDIFFAVAVEDLLSGVQVCSRIMEKVNCRIRKDGNGLKLGVSIGVDITFNRQPVRYYMEMVEEQLKRAKAKTIPKALKPFAGDMKICVGGLPFVSVEYDRMKAAKAELGAACGKRGCRCSSCREKAAIKEEEENELIWEFFKNDVKFLNYIRSRKGRCSELLGRPNFFYTLLEDIAAEERGDDKEKSDIRYMNHILYHLLPRYLGDADREVRESELALNMMLIRRLFRREGGVTKICIKNETKQQFERYLRLLLLFSDVRFRIYGEGTAADNRKDEVKQYLFSGPENYLYEKCGNWDENGAGKELREVLIDHLYRKDLRRGGYKRLVLDKSTFFRMRSVGYDRAADIIEARNPSTDEEKQNVKDLNDRREKEGKLPNRLFFDRERFLKLAEQSGLWSEDYVDALMLLYEYNEKKMEYLKEDASKKKGNRKGSSPKSTFQKEGRKHEKRNRNKS